MPIFMYHVHVQHVSSSSSAALHITKVSEVCYNMYMHVHVCMNMYVCYTS